MAVLGAIKGSLQFIKAASTIKSMSAVKRTTHRGFTIVELLIVIVVIAILAAISIVAYTGIQARARDSQVASAANQIEKAIRLFHVNTGKQPHSGSQSTGPIADKTCPGSTVAAGFAGKGSYSCTLEDLLVADNQLPSRFFDTIPPNKAYGNVSRVTFMFYQCYPAVNNEYALYWYLENPSSEETAAFDALRAKCGNSDSVRDSWGMRAGKAIRL